MTLTKQQSTVYPGMLCSGIEFFAVESGMKFISEGKVQSFSEIPSGIAMILNEEIESTSEVKSALLEWHPNSNFQRMLQFAKCRFGGLDFSADIENNQLKDGDYWDCPNRSVCKYSGVLCKQPKYNGFELSTIEIKLMKLTSTTQTNETIASNLDLALGSFHKIKQALYSKLGVQTKQEVALIAKSLNII